MYFIRIIIINDNIHKIILITVIHDLNNIASLEQENR